MRSGKRAFVAVMVAALAACTPADPEGQNTANAQTPRTGPCVGTLCLGTDAAPYVSDCPDSVSVTERIKIKQCPISDPLSIAGFPATSATLTIVEGKAARIRLWFNAASCPLVATALYKSLGESTIYNFMQDNYSGLYNSLGEENRSPPYSMHDRQWQSENGQFVMSGSSSNLGSGCEVRVDSVNVAREISSKIGSEAESSIQG